MSAPSTRERILDAALDLFATDGVAGTTITEIERRAGLAAGSGSLYRHFRSKDEVLEEAVRREVDRLMAVVASERAALPAVEDPEARLRTEYRQTLADIRAFDRLFRVLQQGGVRSARTAIVGALAGGGDEDAERVAVVVSALLGHHLLGRFHGGPFLGVDDDRFVDALVAMTTPWPPGTAAGR